MTEPSKSTRREFLRGRAAAQTLAERVQRWTGQVQLPDGSSAASAASLLVQATRRAMACEFEAQYHATDVAVVGAVLEAFDLIERIEDQMTIYRDHSDLIEINQHAATAPVEVELKLFTLLQTAERVFHETEGAFDISSTPLSRAWGFLRREGKPPSESELQEALEQVGFENVVLDTKRRTVRFRQPGVELNLNSIGKGYALDRAAELMDTHGAVDYLLHGGRSSVVARGCNRADADHGWTLGLCHPQRVSERIAEFYLHDRALATAGGATQCFTHDGQQYSHLIDPRTGRPAEGVYTATVLAPTAAEADALATSFFVMGPNAVGEYCADHPDIAAVLVCPADTHATFAVVAWGLSPNDWQIDTTLMAPCNS